MRARTFVVPSIYSDELKLTSVGICDRRCIGQSRFVAVTMCLEWATPIVSSKSFLALGRVVLNIYTARAQRRHCVPTLTYSMAGSQFVAARRATDLRDKGRAARFLFLLNCTTYSGVCALSLSFKWRVNDSAAEAHSQLEYSSPRAELRSTSRPSDLDTL
ncbi:hypothetical protein DFH11DRAFT_1748312 [Phellopilus nigrolimitatus]|nr:hypothetical protein DFH11DRAFT_1748312 [Phellopilus nigrolimitatus]